MYTPSCVFFVIILPPTTHREGLLRVGSLPRLCTYLQHVVFDRFGLAHHTNAAARPSCAMQTVVRKRPPTTLHLNCIRPLRAASLA